MAKDQDKAQLCRLLTLAAERLNAVQGPIWSAYESGSDLARFVLECQTALTQGTMTLPQKNELWRIFAPTCDWDDVVGEIHLGNEVFSLLDHLFRKEIFNEKRPPG